MFFLQMACVILSSIFTQNLKYWVENSLRNVFFLQRIINKS